MGDFKLTNLQETAASLRFLGDDLDPDEISSRLGTEPTVAVRKGGIHFTPKSAPIVAHTGKWILKTERRSPGDLDKQIDELLAPIAASFETWRHVASRFNGHIFAGLFIARINEGISLNSKTLAALGSRGLTLDLDIYKRDDVEED